MIKFSEFFVIYEAFEAMKSRMKQQYPSQHDMINYLFNKYEQFRNAQQLLKKDKDLQQIIKKGIEYFKEVMDEYPDEPVTKQTLMKKVVAENDEWVVFKVSNALECYRLAHGLGHWCIVADRDEEEGTDNQYWFDKYTEHGKWTMFIARRRAQFRKYDSLDCICIMISTSGCEHICINADNDNIDISRIPNFVPLKLLK